MPALKLKTGGVKPGRKSTAKPASVKRTATKPSARKTASKATKTATTKRTTRQAEPEEEVVDRRTARGKVDPKVLARHEDKLVAVGERMDAAQAERDAALAEAYKVTQAALGDDVPMALVHQLTGISRQWLYNMGKHGGRGGSVTEGRRNGTKPKARTTRKPATKTTARKTTASKAKTPAKRTAKSTGAKKKLSIKSR